MSHWMLVVVANDDADELYINTSVWSYSSARKGSSQFEQLVLGSAWYTILTSAARAPVTLARVTCIWISPGLTNSHRHT